LPATETGCNFIISTSTYKSINTSTYTSTYNITSTLRCCIFCLSCSSFLAASMRLIMQLFLDAFATELVLVLPCIASLTGPLLKET